MLRFFFIIEVIKIFNDFNFFKYDFKVVSNYFYFFKKIIFF